MFLYKIGKAIAKVNNLSLPLVILIASFILGGFYYTSQISKQRFIERQQRDRLEQEEKEYMAERERDCLNIYKTESNKWNNVVDWRYIEPSGSIFDFGDTCRIIYKDLKTGKEFSKYY